MCECFSVDVCHLLSADSAFLLKLPVPSPQHSFSLSDAFPLRRGRSARESILSQRNAPETTYSIGPAPMISVQYWTILDITNIEKV